MYVGCAVARVRLTGVFVASAKGGERQLIKKWSINMVCNEDKYQGTTIGQGK